MDFINYLKNHTECAALRKIVDLLPIIKLEKEEMA
jgi:hypothetical protein